VSKDAFDCLATESRVVAGAHEALNICAERIILRQTIEGASGLVERIEQAAFRHRHERLLYALRVSTEGGSDVLRTLDRVGIVMKELKDIPFDQRTEFSVKWGEVRFCRHGMSGSP
jgi:hypothetical protein